MAEDVLPLMYSDREIVSYMTANSIMVAIILLTMVYMFSQRHQEFFTLQSGYYWLLDGCGLVCILIAFTRLLVRWPNLPPLWAWYLYFLGGYPLIYIPTIVRVWRIFCFLAPTLTFPYITMQWTDPLRNTPRGYPWMCKRMFLLGLPFILPGLVLPLMIQKDGWVRAVTHANDCWSGAAFLVTGLIICVCGAASYAIKHNTNRNTKILQLIDKSKILFRYTLLSTVYSIINFVVWNLLIRRYGMIDLLLIHSWLATAFVCLFWYTGIGTICLSLLRKQYPAVDAFNINRAAMGSEGQSSGSLPVNSIMMVQARDNNDTQQSVNNMGTECSTSATGIYLVQVNLPFSPLTFVNIPISFSPPPSTTLAVPDEASSARTSVHV
eukprot:GILK01010116.1.p1 GENE.GILK01010116.1~~GILK01010116.1.p1  ORF type:complete len:380 (-),score=16.70 GILK01010116.1:169-1308(-)